MKFLKINSVQNLLLLISISSLVACTTNIEQPSANKQLLLKVKKGLVIRGGTCSRKAFIAGAESSSQNGDYISNLSVNCTAATNDKDDYIHYLTGINNANVCVATWPSLEIANITIKTNPISGNPIHCLVSGNTNDIVKKLTRYQ